jgi:hypothetical protein
MHYVDIIFNNDYQKTHCSTENAVCVNCSLKVHMRLRFRHLKTHLDPNEVVVARVSQCSAKTHIKSYLLM